MKRGRLHLFLIPLAALIPILPLLLHDCSCGHDFDFHILNWLEAARQFTHGTLHPQWAFTPGWNAGEPRFVFYPPLSWTLGAILGLIMPWTWTPIAYTWLVLTGAGLAFNRLARSFVGTTAALLAAVFYLTNPYVLFTAYERTAYAELLAAIWIPLLLDAILRERPTIPRIAIPIALLWLSNAPAGVMCCYALALITLVRLIPTRLILERDTRLRLALTSATGTALGLGLAAFYLVPAAWERRYVEIDMAILPGLRIQDNTLFHHTTAGITDPDALAEAIFHDTVLHTASTIALILLAVTVIALAAVALKTTRTKADAPSAKNEIPEFSRLTLYALAVLTATIVILLTPISLPLWHHLPELAFLQFPWRLLALLAAAASLATALSLRTVTLKPAVTTTVALLLAAALTCPAYTVFRQTCDPEDTVAARTTQFRTTQGSEPTDEYTPISADNDALAHANPPYWLSPDPESAAPINTHPGPVPRDLTVNSPIPQTLILNLRNYPAWHLIRNNALIPEREARLDGLIAIPIPAGPSQIHLTYTQLPDQTLGLILTALSLILLITLILQSNTRTDT
ncbi:MAG: Membrane protein 6-pyruvoyl-tetrahydropterin synthase-related domain protein [Acidobacteriaceae bacterium]|nr:Membrane protein 6-pyruvoyl-tetrahydropterin synthase-related domain protein [Acidobacteriaceae bacterium]